MVSRMVSTLQYTTAVLLIFYYLHEAKAIENRVKLGISPKKVHEEP